MFLCETEGIMKCPKCKKEITSFHHYYIYDKGDKKVIEICKECYEKRKVHRMNVRVKGETIVID